MITHYYVSSFSKNDDTKIKIFLFLTAYDFISGFVVENNNSLNIDNQFITINCRQSETGTSTITFTNQDNQIDYIGLCNNFSQKYNLNNPYTDILIQNDLFADFIEDYKRLFVKSAMVTE